LTDGAQQAHDEPTQLARLDLLLFSRRESGPSFRIVIALSLGLCAVRDKGQERYSTPAERSGAIAMTGRQTGLTRRSALACIAGIGGLAATGTVSGDNPLPPAFEKIPISGKAGPGLEALDTAILDVMDRQGIPGAAFAFAWQGKLLFAKGYGWANVTTGEAVTPKTSFGLASLSKTLTAVAALKLVEQGKLSLDDKVFDILKDIQPPLGARVDPRLKDITVLQCLNHSGGWDRGIKGDPINWEPQICRAYRVRAPLSSRQLLEFMKSQPLEFDPGARQSYSNVGYVIMGEVIARVSGKTYERYVIDQVLKPMGISAAGLHAFDGKYLAGEAARYLAGALVVLPAMLMPMVEAAGGWSASVVDMVRLLTNLDGSRGKPVINDKMRQAMLDKPPAPIKPRENGTWFGLGWDIVIMKDSSPGYFKEGAHQGMRTFMKRLPSGLNWALLCNASLEMDPYATQAARNAAEEIRKSVEDNEKYPDIDLFKEFDGRD
jgi:CubicO group peptidase (beta-lactamase class C family)